MAAVLCGGSCVYRGMSLSLECSSESLLNSDRASKSFISTSFDNMAVQCKQCHIVFNSEQVFRAEHVKFSGHSGCLFLCGQCLDPFNTAKERDQHVKVDHRDRPLTPDYDPRRSWLPASSASKESTPTPTAAAASPVATPSHDDPVNAKRAPTPEEKPKLCSGCNKPVSSGDVHLECITGMISCPVCAKDFLSGASLARHAELTRPCNVCQTCLSRSKNLSDHYRASPMCDPRAINFDPDAPSDSEEEEDSKEEDREEEDRISWGSPEPASDIPSEPAAAQLDIKPEELPVAVAEATESELAALAPLESDDATIVHDLDDDDDEYLSFAAERPPWVESDSESDSATDVGSPPHDHDGSSPAEEGAMPSSPKPALVAAGDKLLQPSSYLPDKPHSRRAIDQGARKRALSYHCRSCLQEPCVDPVISFCGHLFCHRCLIEELRSRMCCPECQRPFMVQMHVAANS
ncbi:hypothetical protein C8Q74DRAFT_100270 [Fomes fomentarius]|nr:hypothetical protein C8Q74DRAFT_100270 [Fomes fomentarius]